MFITPNVTAVEDGRTMDNSVPQAVTTHIMEDKMIAFELHKPLLIIKAVDPGCTLELQIENCANGEVTRLTTTDKDDLPEFEMAVVKAFRTAWLNVERNAQ